MTILIRRQNGDNKSFIKLAQDNFCYSDPYLLPNTGLNNGFSLWSVFCDNDRCFCLSAFFMRPFFMSFFCDRGECVLNIYLASFHAIKVITMSVKRSKFHSFVCLFTLFVCFSASSLFVSTAHADDNKDKGGFSLGSTRVIYDGSKKEATITVINSAKNAPFLAQSWVTEYAPGKKQPAQAPFLVTPPLYRQDQGKNMLRIIRTGGQMPSDRESVFWLNVKAIPAARESLKGKNTLQFAYVLRVKLFYRPQGLSGESSRATDNLSFSRQGSMLAVRNSGSYYVTFNTLSVGGKTVKDASSLMVPPKGEQLYTLPAGATGNQVSFRALNDFGGVLPARTVTF